MKENEPTPPTDQTAGSGGDHAENHLNSALDFFRRSAARDGQASWQAASAWQEARLAEWAGNLGLLLNPADYLPRLIRGGQEHDVFPDGERFFKITRSGVFGLTPGIELALVPSDQDARRFHLWEALPFQYLERLRLQNAITEDLNQLEGVIVQGSEVAICISQPLLALNPVSQDEITKWFSSLGFETVAPAAYYRAEDNLGVFDAHDKNVVRSDIDPNHLIPFDVIPVQPDGGFLDFIQETLAQGQSLKVVRTAHTTTRTS